MLRFSPTCSFIRTRQISYRGFLKMKMLAGPFNPTFNYIDVVLPESNPKFADYVDCSYPTELAIKDTTDTSRSLSLLYPHREIDRECRLTTKRYYKRDYFNFPIVNFPLVCSNISELPVYGVYMSQLIPYSSTSGSYHYFLGRWLLLTKNLSNQWFLVVILESLPRKFYGRHHDLVNRYGVSLS